MKVNMALQKWKATIYEANMPPEAIIKALQERVNRQRMLKEKFEFCKPNWRPSSRLKPKERFTPSTRLVSISRTLMKINESLLIRILTRMMKIKQHYAMQCGKIK